MTKHRPQGAAVAGASSRLNGDRTTALALSASDGGLVSGDRLGESAVTGGPAGTVNPWLVIVIVCGAQFMVVLDATIVNVALPSIQRGLRVSPSTLQWVINMYTLTFRGFILIVRPS